jgi:hypothetical protein
MPDAFFNHAANEQRTTLAGALGAGEIWQLKDGRAAYYDTSIAASSGEKVYIRTDGQATVTKASGVVFLDGQPVYWDHSANSATYKAVNDRDFYIGTAVGDWASGDTTALVNFNVKPEYLIDFGRGGSTDAFLTTIVGTTAVAGCNILRRGAAHHFVLNSTNEAQKLDALSVNGFATGANWIVEGEFRVVSDGAGTNTDVSLGIANGTHASDADSITESVFIHLNGNEVNIYAESDDGTTEVAATDTTVDYTEGSALSTRVHFMIDGRDPADVQIYINGALVLGSTTFNVNVATGPWFLLAHVEKASSADTYELALDSLRVRIAEQ